MKKGLSVFILLLILCSAAGCSSAGGSFEEVDAAKLPSKIDLRDYNGKSYVTKVKSQKFGDCWTFALAGAAETAYLVANDLGAPAGEINYNVDFSEKYIAWYMFHGITGDDVAAGKVRASQVGEGFDPSEAQENNELAVYIIGGPFIHSANLFGSGFGPVDESVSVKGEYPYAYNDSWEGEWTLPLTSEYRCAPTTAFLRESRVLSDPASFDENGDYSLNEEGLIAMKSELSQGHGVSVALRTAHGGFNRENRAAYYSGSDHPDHAVAVVGYDDDYPKENFSLTDQDGKVIEGSTPPDDGAFIIKNSWGIVNEEEDGYFYLSYYDHSISSPLSYVFDDLKALRHTEPLYDQYDLMMTQWYGSTDYDSETKIANIFDAEDDETLYQIAYRTALPRTGVAYEIYRDVEEGDPASGVLLEKGAGYHLYPGSHKIDLKSEYPLKKGEKYAVVLTMQRDDADGTVYSEIFPYSAEFFPGMTVHGIVNEGESFLYTDGVWNDMTDRIDRLTEQACRQCAEELETNIALPEITLNKDSVTVDNYPIKAISAPRDNNK